MADNITLPASGVDAATDDAGAGGHVQIIKLAISADGSATVIPADATNGLDVDVTRLPALVAGTAAIGKLAANSGVDIGDVDVTSVPADPFGANADAAVAAAAAGSIQAKLRRLTTDIDAIKTSVAAATPAGTNNIGDVDLASAIPAGTNNIGDIDVLTVPADPFGVNADAAVAAGAVGSIQAKLRRLTTDIDAIKTSVAAATPAGTNNIGDVDIASAIPAGTNNIGDVDVLTLPATPAGTNNIGDVDVLTLPAVEHTRPATSTLSNVASSATSVQLLASTAGRKGVAIYNDSTAVCYVKFGTTASATSYTVQLGPGAFYEAQIPVYTGRIDAIWAAANGNARITELTA